MESINGDAATLVTPTGLQIKGRDATGNLTQGDAAKIFVRPEAIRLSTTADALDNVENLNQGIIENILFNGANSHILLREEKSGGELNVAIPQTGQFRDLKRGDKVYIGWEAEQTRCYRES